MVLEFMHKDEPSIRASSKKINRFFFFSFISLILFSFIFFLFVLRSKTKCYMDRRRSVWLQLYQCWWKRGSLNKFKWFQMGKSIGMSTPFVRLRMKSKNKLASWLHYEGKWHLGVILKFLQWKLILPLTCFMPWLSMCITAADMDHNGAAVRANSSSLYPQT